MNDKNIFELDPAKVATFKAERLLKAGRQSGGGGGGGARKGDTNVWPRDEFMDAWSASLPDGCEAELPFLGGIALVHEGKSATIEYFPCSALPTGTKERFKLLFEKRAKWELQDLEPYVNGLVTTQTTKAQLLLKHTRSSIAPAGSRAAKTGGRLYSRR